MRCLIIYCLILVVLICAVPLHAAVLFEDDFDGYSGSPRNNGWLTMGGNVSVQEGSGYSGSRGVKIAYTRSGTDPYWFGFSIEKHHTLDVYVKFRFKIENSPTGGCKFLKIFGKTFDPEGYANSTFGLDQWSLDLREVAYGTGDSIRNDTQATIKFSGKSTDSQVMVVKTSGPFEAADNQWHTYEGHVKFNSDGKRDGIYEVWIDNVQVLRANNVKNRNNSNSKSISNVQFGNYSGRTFSTSWNLYIDDVVASTTRATSTPDIPLPGMVRNFKRD